MSITFFIPSEPVELVGTYLCCNDAGCCFCKGTGTWEDRERPSTLNMSNSNTSMLLHILDIEFDYAGSVAPDALLASIERARAEHPPISDEDYFHMRMDILETIAKKAQELGSKEVVWS